MILNLFLLLICFLQSASAVTSVFSKGMAMMQLLVEKPGRPTCVSEDLRQHQLVSAFAYNIQPTHDDVPMELSLFDDSPSLLVSKGPEKKEVELEAMAKKTGMHTLCVKTALTSNRPNVAVMVGIFVLTAPGNDTDDDRVHFDDSFGVYKLENLTHVATRAMLAISNAQHYARQSALYMIQDTVFLEGIMAKMRTMSILTSTVVVVLAAIQVHVLKTFFHSRTRVGA